MVAKIFLRGCSFPKTFPTLTKYFVVPYISVCPQVRYGFLASSAPFAVGYQVEPSGWHDSASASLGNNWQVR